MKTLLLVLLVSTAALAEGPDRHGDRHYRGRVHAERILVSTCYELPAFKKEQVKRLGRKKGEAYDTIYFNYPYRRVETYRVILATSLDGVVFDDEVKSTSTKTERFRCSEQEGNEAYLAKRIQEFIDEKSFDSCPVTPPGP